MIILLYPLLVLGVNVGFAHAPQLALLWSIIVGVVFLARDVAQQRIGHHVLWLMLAGVLLSYFLASPVVAIASASAFALSEGVDWLVYTFTKRPFHDRLLLSSAVAVPIDSIVFLAGVGALSLGLVATQIASKMLAALVTYALLRRTAPAIGR